METRRVRKMGMQAVQGMQACQVQRGDLSRLHQVFKCFKRAEPKKLQEKLRKSSTELLGTRR